MKSIDPYARLNPYHMNRMGHVIRLNDDGSTTQLGTKARLVALAFTNITTGIVVAAAAYQAYQAGKAKGAIDLAQQLEDERNAMEADIDRHRVPR